MPRNYLKSEKKHPYQKTLYPFWRDTYGRITGYSEESKRYFDDCAIRFERDKSKVQ